MVKANKALEKGDLVLITGGTGWVGSHVVEKAIEQDLKVRLAIRDEKKAKRLIDGLQEKFGKTKDVCVETVFVSDFSKEGAYDEAVQGIQGIIHVASNLDFSDKFEEIVLPSLKAYEILFNAAHKQGPAIKRVVITSSSVSLGFPVVDPKGPVQHWTTKTWNEDSVRKAKEEPNSWDVYAASKVLTEQFAWNFVKEKQCEFVLNVINPNACFGAKVIGTEYGSTGTWIRRVCLEKNESLTQIVPSQFHVDVEDVGLLHVLALLQEDIVNERILAFGEKFTWDQVIDLTEKYCPDIFNAHSKSEQTAQKDNTTVDVSRTQEILQPFGGLKSLDYSIQRNLQD